MTVNTENNLRENWWILLVWSQRWSRSVAHIWICPVTKAGQPEKPASDVSMEMSLWRWDHQNIPCPLSHPQRTLKQDPQRDKRAQMPKTWHRWNPSNHWKKNKPKAGMEIHCFWAVQPWSRINLGWCRPVQQGRLSWQISAGCPGCRRGTGTSPAPRSFRRPHSSALLTRALAGALP